MSSSDIEAPGHTLVQTPANRSKRIAIVGSGVSGLGALYSLRNTGHDVHLYEAADRLGGHTNTLPFKHQGKTIMVDTGFIVMNTATYPNFIPFLKELGLKTVPTAMTFGITRDQGAFEWSGTSLRSIFAQKRNFFRPTFWRMIFDIVRFNQFALDLLSDEDCSENEMSIGEYLRKEGYSDVFRDDYLIPMTASVWSTGADKCALEFPAVTLVRFMWNHHLLNTIAKRPDWLTIPGGSKQYIDALMAKFPQENVHLSHPVYSVYGDSVWGTTLQFKNGEKAHFDEVILACHGDQAHTLISKTASKLEREILGEFHTTPNTVYLHSDASLLPRRKVAWSAWNYLTTSSPTKRRNSIKAAESPAGALQTVALTYNMNILQHIPTSKFGNVLVTMNPPHAPRPSLTQAKIEYSHPLYNAAAVRAQDRLQEIQGERGIWYCGAWTNYGFHEDGFSSGVAVGRKLGGNVPWKVVDAKFMRGKRPGVSSWDNLGRVFVLAIQIFISLWEYACCVLVMSMREGAKKRKVR
ncbi:NADP-dependent alcohol dehydrogenase 6 [Venturia nashicola]|uniref:NADP-dependent alcohol dehydrogenase 6 n=1 Tax=Venturia nashicola TaxID=86259 RepID=A0A4Z1PFR3_9PEZI|nr:NADP-dependent alcohol dehydrogenase 6 [Venturia nashicola]